MSSSEAIATGEARITTRQRLYVFAVILVVVFIVVLGIAFGL